MYSVRKLNERTLKEWEKINENMITEKFRIWEDQNYEEVLAKTEAIIEKLQRLEVRTISFLVHPSIGRNLLNFYWLQILNRTITNA